MPRDAPEMSDGFTGAGNSLKGKFTACKLVNKISFTSLFIILVLSNQTDQIARFLHQQCLYDESVDPASFRLQIVTMKRRN